MDLKELVPLLRAHGSLQVSGTLQVTFTSGVDPETVDRLERVLGDLAALVRVPEPAVEAPAAVAEVKPAAAPAPPADAPPPASEAPADPPAEPAQ